MQLKPPKLQTMSLVDKSDNLSSQQPKESFENEENKSPSIERQDNEANVKICTLYGWLLFLCLMKDGIKCKQTTKQKNFGCQWQMQADTDPEILQETVLEKP